MKIKPATKIMAALAHEGRLNLFKQLVRAGELGENAGDLARFAKINFTTASAQLLVLENAGLVKTRRNGRYINYTARFDTMRDLLAFLMMDCCAKRPEICDRVLEDLGA